MRSPLVRLAPVEYVNGGDGCLYEEQAHHVALGEGTQGLQHAATYPGRLRDVGFLVNIAIQFVDKQRRLLLYEFEHS